jgi:Cutinase
VVVDTTSGPVTMGAGEYGFNTIFDGASNITGFQVEAVEEEEAGFGIDNLEYTVPVPPPPPAPVCPKYAIYDTRGSGEAYGKLSKPGKEFIKGFKARLNSLHGGGSVSEISNPYPAVGVFSWRHFSQDLNGLGAFLGVGKIGAYKDSEAEGEKDLRSYIAQEVKSACGDKSKIILLGYSQGAQATGNVYQHLHVDQRKRVAAVVLWGDPDYNHADNAADRDTRGLNGSLGTRSKFPEGSKVFSYCNKHDPICQWRLPVTELMWYRLKEHSLYWKSKPPEAENNGRAVAVFLVKQR